MKGGGAHTPGYHQAIVHGAHHVIHEPCWLFNEHGGAGRGEYWQKTTLLGTALGTRTKPAVLLYDIV